MTEQGGRRDSDSTVGDRAVGDMTGELVTG